MVLNGEISVNESMGFLVARRSRLTNPLCKLIIRPQGLLLTRSFPISPPYICIHVYPERTVGRVFRAPLPSRLLVRKYNRLCTLRIHSSIVSCFKKKGKTVAIRDTSPPRLKYCRNYNPNALSYLASRKKCSKFLLLIRYREFQLFFSFSLAIARWTEISTRTITFILAVRGRR